MKTRSLTYRPELDGLRAFAVIPVILFHFGFEWLKGGYIGVDIFFVLSGFLITSILIKDFNQGTFSFKRFWSRRIKRLLPVLVIVVFVTLIASQRLLYGPDLFFLGNQSIATLLSFANISQWLTAGDYWGFAAENSPLLHAWSLSVEEQFYLFFPFFIFLTLRYFSKYLIHLILLFCFLSLALFVYGTQNHPDATFYLLPTRAWELGIGALLAIYNDDKLLVGKMSKNGFINLFSLFGLLLVTLSYVALDGSNGISPFLIIPVLGAGLIILYSASEKTLVNNVLSLPVVVYIGKISYSLYLWHWPILVLSRNLTLRTKTEYSILSLLGVILFLSMLSYHLIENPARKNKKTVPIVLGLLLIGVIYSYTLAKSDYREDISMFSPTTYSGELYTSRPTEIAESSKRKKQGVYMPVRENRNLNAYKEGGTINIYGKDVPEIVVLGDSHALMWASTIDTIAKRLNKSISVYAAEGTPTFFDIPVIQGSGSHYFSSEQRFEYNQARLKYLKQWKPRVVFIIQSWSNLENVESTNDLIHFLGEIGSQVILIEQPPELFYGNKNATQFLSYYGLTPKGHEKGYLPYIDSDSYKSGREAVRTIVANCDYCELIKIADIFNRGKEGWVLDGSEVLYIDEDHLSEAGASKVNERILNALDNKFENQ